jgi:hypothetical protein
MPKIRAARSGSSRMARVVLAMLSAPSSRRAPMARLRSAAMARGALPVCTVEASSSKVRSRTWWPAFSTAQCPRTRSPNSRGPAWWTSCPPRRLHHRRTRRLPRRDLRGDRRRGRGLAGGLDRPHSRAHRRAPVARGPAERRHCGSRRPGPRLRVPVRIRPSGSPCRPPRSGTATSYLPTLAGATQRLRPTTSALRARLLSLGTSPSEQLRPSTPGAT